MAARFILELRDLDAAGKSFKSVIPAAWLRGALEGCEVSPAGDDGDIELRYSKSGTDVILRGRVRATLEAACSRCTAPAKLPFDVELSLLLVPATSSRGDFAKGRKGETKKPSDEYEMQGSDADFDTYEGDEIALDPFIREALLLEVPPFPLCSEECRGIAPPPSEVDRGPTIDPRLAPLLKFKKQGN